MDKLLFWKLIEDARAEAHPSDEIAPILVDKLVSKDVGEIMRWMNIFDAYQRLAYKPKLWAAAYVINGGCSDDGFDYFRGWLTAQGKDVFLKALSEPESLAALNVDMDEAEYEDMLAVGYNAYFRKMDMANRDYQQAFAVAREHALSESEQQDLVADIHYASDIDAPWDEQDLEAVVPKLCAKFQ